MLLALIKCDGPGCKVSVVIPFAREGATVPEGWYRYPPYVRKRRGKKHGRVKHFCLKCTAKAKETYGERVPDQDQHTDAPKEPRRRPDKKSDGRPYRYRGRRKPGT